MKNIPFQYNFGSQAARETHSLAIGRVDGGTGARLFRSAASVGRCVVPSKPSSDWPATAVEHNENNFLAESESRAMIAIVGRSVPRRDGGTCATRRWSRAKIAERGAERIDGIRSPSIRAGPDAAGREAATPAHVQRRQSFSRESPDGWAPALQRLSPPRTRGSRAVAAPIQLSALSSLDARFRGHDNDRTAWS
jgi:hypothetical protein